MKDKLLLNAGWTIPVVFFATTFICGFVQGGYNHLSRQVSELGTIGTNSQYPFTAGLLLSAFLSVLFIVGLLQACLRLQLSIWPVLLMLSFTFSMAGAAIFPLPLPMHMTMGSPAFLLLLSPLLALLLWPQARLLAGMKGMAALGLLIMALGFTVYLPDLLAAYPGLKQRLFHLGWAVWFVYLSIAFRRALENNSIKSGQA
jgi:hypothetical membrane protein